MIVGYHREMLVESVEKNFPEINFKFIVNHHYFETNTAYSIYVGRKALSDQHLLMNADVVYPKEMLSKLYHSSFENVLAVDIKSCGREEVKVIDGGQHKISAIGKDLIEDQCLGTDLQSDLFQWLKSYVARHQ